MLLLVGSRAAHEIIIGITNHLNNCAIFSSIYTIHKRGRAPPVGDSWYLGTRCGKCIQSSCGSGLTVVSKLLNINCNKNRVLF